MNTKHTNAVLITGANRGLGLGFVTQFVNRDNFVVACCRDANKAADLKKLKNKHPDEISIEALDVSNEDSINQHIKKIHNLKFDLVINNAGICLEENIGTYTKEGFQKTFEVNTFGVALFSQAILPCIKKGGKLINVSSGMGSINLNINPTAALDAYAMSKAALNIFTVRLAQKLLSKKIITCALSPGWVQTDMGGPEAPSTVDLAVADMIKTIEKLQMKDSGKFLSEIGEALPW